MSHKEIISETSIDYITDIANGGDDPVFKTQVNDYIRTIQRGGKADIWYRAEVWRSNNGGKAWFKSADVHRLEWAAYSMSKIGQFDRAKAESQGLPVKTAFDILNMRLIKRIQGESVDPTMFLSELDDNFAMVTKRVSQAVEFVKNVRNPKRLAQLTLGYFKGSETRRSLTKRYSRAKRAFLRRTARWKTRDWSTSYLEYQFGWRPLCDDIWKLVGLAREAKRRHDQFSAKVGLQPQTWSVSWKNAGPIGRATDVATCEGSTAGHAVIRFRIDNPWLRQGASLEPPSYTAWDAVPFSWLVDCVTNVGDHLKYALYHSGLALIGGYRSVLRRMSCGIFIDTSKEVVRQKSLIQETSYEVNGSLTHTSVHCQRQIYRRWPAVPWFWKFENTFRNTELLVTLGAYTHQLLAKMADSKRPWLSSPHTP